MKEYSVEGEMLVSLRDDSHQFGYRIFMSLESPYGNVKSKYSLRSQNARRKKVQIHIHSQYVSTQYHKKVVHCTRYKTVPPTKRSWFEPINVMPYLPPRNQSDVVRSLNKVLHVLLFLPFGYRLVETACFLRDHGVDCFCE